jgi:hypothetical protein
MELRVSEAFSLARETVAEIGLNWSTYLAHVGYDQKTDDWVPLCASTPLHIIFSAEELDGWDRPFDLKPHHITWRLPLSDRTTHRFGGPHHGVCASCGYQLHHLITLNPIPENLTITGLKSLTIATCLSCLGWHLSEAFFYKHDEQGQPIQAGSDIVRTQSLEKLPDITETEVCLAYGGKRWHWQDWGSSNSRENLHRIGGFPSWVQGSDYPICPECRKRMRFILQLDDACPVFNADYWIDGILYVCWCDGCRMSSIFWQST